MNVNNSMYFKDISKEITATRSNTCVLFTKQDMPCHTVGINMAFKGRGKIVVMFMVWVNGNMINQGRALQLDTKSACDYIKNVVELYLTNHATYA